MSIRYVGWEQQVQAWEAAKYAAWTQTYAAVTAAGFGIDRAEKAANQAMATFSRCVDYPRHPEEYDGY